MPLLFPPAIPTGPPLFPPEPRLPRTPRTPRAARAARPPRLARTPRQPREARPPRCPRPSRIPRPPRNERHVELAPSWHLAYAGPASTKAHDGSNTSSSPFGSRHPLNNKPTSDTATSACGGRVSPSAPTPLPRDDQELAANSHLFFIDFGPSVANGGSRTRSSSTTSATLSESGLTLVDNVSPGSRDWRVLWPNFARTPLRLSLSRSPPRSRRPNY